MVKNYCFCDVQVITHHVHDTSRVPQRFQQGPASLAGSFMDGDQQAVSSPRIHSIVILEWTPISLTCSCSSFTFYRLYTSPMRDASRWSTDASLLSMGEAALASSSWLSTLEGLQLPFNCIRASLLGVLLPL